tara:strand:+ start:999 stop:1373 length:375 start_codon:yes stop_codon:yes gene_type:complete
MLEHAFSTALLCITVTGLVVLLLVVVARRQNKKRPAILKYSLRELLRQDKRLAQIVSHLSYLHDLSGETQLENSLVRKKMKLILEVRMRIRKYKPNSSTEEVSRVCQQLIVLSRTLSHRQKHEQ